MYKNVIISVEPDVCIVNELLADINDRERSYVSRHLKEGLLHHSYIFRNDDTGSPGIMVVIKDERYEAYVEWHQKKDAGYKTKPLRQYIRDYVDQK